MLLLLVRNWCFAIFHLSGHLHGPCSMGVGVPTTQFIKYHPQVVR